MQRLKLSAAEFLGSNGPERNKKCRQFAAEASETAARAIDSGSEKTYLDLGKQWDELANEIERIENEGTNGDR